MNKRIDSILSQIKLLGINRTVRFMMEPVIEKKNILRLFVENRSGVEIGGPSSIFFSNKPLSIYPFVKSLDNVNYGLVTIWNEKAPASNLFQFGNRFGKQFIMEASNLKSIQNDSYDFVASSHMLEHLSNPVKALFEMKRVVNNEGFIILVVPHKEITFDHKRKTTSIAHMIDDFDKNLPEGDISHLDLGEIANDYDFQLDHGIASKEEFIARTMNNNSNRALHQHVFETETVLQLLNYCGLKIVLVRPTLSYGILVVSQKLSGLNDNMIYQNNEEFLSCTSPWRKHSPFKLDKICNTV